MLFSSLLAQATPGDPNSVFGSVEAPAGVALYDSNSGGDIGLILFASNLIKIATIVAGIWVLLNFIMAGYTYITSNGDTGAHKKVLEQISMSVIGLVLIVAAYTIAAILGLLIFGRADYILNPQICGPTGC